MVTLYGNVGNIIDSNWYNNNMTLNFKKGYEKKELPSFVECWRGIGIIVGIWAVIYSLIMLVTGNIK